MQFVNRELEEKVKHALPGSPSLDSVLSNG